MTVYKLDLQSETVVALKLDENMPSGDWASGASFPYIETLNPFIEERIYSEDKERLKEELSLERLREELSVRPEYTGNYRAELDGVIHNFQFVCVAYQTDGQPSSHALIGFRNIDEIVRREQKQNEALKDALHMARTASEAKTSLKRPSAS